MAPAPYLYWNNAIHNFRLELPVEVDNKIYLERRSIRRQGRRSLILHLVGPAN